MPLLTLATWFEHADAVDERFGESPYFHAALRHEAHGLCLWMLGRQPSTNPYQLAMESWQRHFESEGKKPRRGGPKFDFATQRYEDMFITGLPFDPRDILQGSLDDYLASCVQCGEFARAAEMYEKVGGRTDIADSRIQTAVHLGYWLCKQGAAGLIPVADAEVIGARVLRSNLRSRWLVGGQFVRAAQWLKIVAQSAASKATPREVIGRASEFMPA